MTWTDSARKALKDAAKFLYPEISRGPADGSWVKAVKQVADALDWPQCPGCKGNPPNGSDCCFTCYNVGKVDPENL